VLKARLTRLLTEIGAGTWRRFAEAWQIAFPIPPGSPPDPHQPSPIAKAAALREPALLQDRVDAVKESSNQR